MSTKKPKKRRTPAKDVPAILRKHAAVLFEIPTGEQFMGGRDAVLHSALRQIADAIDELLKFRDLPVSERSGE